MAEGQAMSKHDTISFKVGFILHLLMAVFGIAQLGIGIIAWSFSIYHSMLCAIWCAVWAGFAAYHILIACRYKT